jgi:hypothetical protein
MRHSERTRRTDRAAQLPTSASGNRLCRHGIAGGCTRWCSYKLFAKVVAVTVVVLGLICGGVWLTGGEGESRVREVVYGVGLYLAVVLPGIVALNSRGRDQ